MKNSLVIKPNDQPKFYQLRWKLSNFFVKVGAKIYPENPEVMAHYLKVMHDMMIYGNCFQIIHPNDCMTKYKNEK